MRLTQATPVELFRRIEVCRHISEAEKVLREFKLRRLCGQGSLYSAKALDVFHLRFTEFRVPKGQKAPVQVFHTHPIR